MTGNLITHKQRLLAYGGLGAALLVMLYSGIYFFSPFNEFTSLLLLNGLVVLAALACALILSQVVAFFEPGEPPRQVWFFFAAALWMWVAAELIWAIYNLWLGEVPNFSVADLLWAGAYIFFTAAMSSQFRLISFDRSQRPTWVSLGIWLIVVMASLGITFLFGGAIQDVFVYFYPIADFALGVAALVLVFAFRGGALARPWLSLFAFVIADSLYIWATTSGIYDWVGRTGWATYLVDIVYLIAYLIVAWGVFNQYITLRFGALTPDPSPTVPVKPH